MDADELAKLVNLLVAELKKEKLLTAALPRLMTLEETAVYLGRSLRAVTHLVAKGKIPPTKFDSKIMIDRVVLDKLITESTGWAL